MEGGSERMAAGVTRLKAAAAGGKGRFLLATFQVCNNVIMSAEVRLMKRSAGVLSV